MKYVIVQFVMSWNVISLSIRDVIVIYLPDACNAGSAEVIGSAIGLCVAYRPAYCRCVSSLNCRGTVGQI